MPRVSARIAVLIGTSTAVALLIAGGVTVIASLRGHDSERLSFELYRSSVAVVERMEGDGAHELPDEIVGYVIVGGRGEVLLRGGVGNVAAPVRRPTGFWYDERGLVVYHRQLGGFGVGAVGGGSTAGGSSGGGRQVLVWYSPDAFNAERRARDALLFGTLAVLVAAVAATGALTVRLIDAERRLEVQERLASLGQAARTISHEIRNPLAALDLHRQLAEAKNASADLAVHLSVIKTEAQRVRRIVEDVQRFVHPERAEPHCIDLVEWLRGLEVSNVETVAGSISLEATTAVQGATAPVPRWRIAHAPASAPVLIDPSHLRVIVDNLIRNALESHTHAGVEKAVELSIHLDRTRVVLAVRDFGPGLSKQSRARIFDPFFTTKSTGTGLGVPLAHSLARAAGGGIVYPRVSVAGGLWALLRSVARPSLRTRETGCVAQLVLPRTHSQEGP